MLHAYPHRHEDRRALPDLSDVEEGQKVTVEGRVVAKSRRSPRPGMLVIDVTLETPSGGRVKATWFNQPWVEKQLREGAALVLTGRVKKFGRSVQLGVEHLETLDNAQDSLSTGRIVGVYDAKEGISQEFLRRAAFRALGPRRSTITCRFTGAGSTASPIWPTPCGACISPATRPT